MIVRPAGPADAAALVALMRGFDAYLTSIPPHDHVARSDADYEALAAILTGPDPAASALLAEAGGAAVGFVAFSSILWMNDAALALWVSDLYVTEAARRTGAGRALLDAAGAEGARRGAKRIVFTVWRLNAPAQRFYERLGATDIAEERPMSLPIRRG